MNIKAKLLEKSDTQQISATFKKREFIVEYSENPQYPEFIKFELIQDRCDLIDPIQPGQEIDVSFNLKGRKWTDPKGEVKYFNSLQAWKIERVNDVSQPSSSPSDDAAFENQKEPDWLQANDDDDLPF
ncbi:MAG: DUF3127 domain-containing protein [Bacteroidota bacterium]